MSWQRIRSEFERLCELSLAERTARLGEMASTDAWLAEQLRAMFAVEDESPAFLERTPAPPAAAALPRAEAGLRLGRFELVRPLGAGGMGAVWEARQFEPARTVAIKLVARSGQSDAERWRFRHEAQVLAQLTHPAIAALYEVGETDLGGTDVAWFAMELVRGAVDLLAWARQRGLGRAERLLLFEQLCEAVEYGHRRGVLHRDLKPSNVLVDQDGQLKLIDFGVARALADGGDHRTATGEIVGTLQYMAPEQVRGDQSAIGTASDVYALGVILYQLLCDAPPFEFAGLPLAKIAATVLEQEPRSPLLARPDLPRDLGWIVLRALAKDPERRYRGPGELLLDLRRWRGHEPVAARAPSVGYRLRKFARRHALGVSVGAILVAGLGLGIGFLVHGLAAAQDGERAARTGERAARRGSALASELARVTVGMFDAIDDDEHSRDVKVHELLDAGRFEPGTFREPAVEFATRELRGRIYGRLGKFKEARYEFERAIDLRGVLARGAADEAVPADEFTVLEARYAFVLTQSGERERGERLLRECLGRLDAATSDRIRLDVCLELVNFLSSVNATQELLDRSDELVATAERVGEPRIGLLARTTRADALAGLGRHDDAAAAAAEVWRRAQELWGADADASCGPLANHVRMLQEAGRNDEAEALYPQLVALTKRVYGATHEHTLTVLSNQVGILMGHAKLAEAVVSMREIVRCYDARGGEPTDGQLIALNNLGMVLNQSGRFAEAEPFLRRAAELSLKLCDARDPDGVKMRFNHAACLAWLKRWREAEPALLELFAQAEQLLPKGHATLGKMRHTIHDAYVHNDHPEAAAAWQVAK